MSDACSSSTSSLVRPSQQQQKGSRTLRRSMSFITRNSGTDFGVQQVRIASTRKSPAATIDSMPPSALPLRPPHDSVRKSTSVKACEIEAIMRIIITMRRLHQKRQQRNSTRRRRSASMPSTEAMPAVRREAVMAGYGSSLSYATQTWPVGFCLNRPNVGVPATAGTESSTPSGRAELLFLLLSNMASLSFTIPASPDESIGRGYSYCKKSQLKRANNEHTRALMATMRWRILTKRETQSVVLEQTLLANSCPGSD
mmetsp:Transcript_28185/g.81532  ORF Transcript_28185/g.81532 Transcript_28185/m.81532 type:complete len:256 (+) Transcript_28185:706-1473(+)